MDVVTLALARKYTDDSVVGLGSIKGANAEVDSITPVSGGNDVVFKWIGTNDAVITKTMTVKDAYGIAVQNGFSGSESDWLNSLTGPVGPPGPAGEVYAHQQPTPASVWLIQHNLGKRCPNCVCVDDNGVQMFGEPDYYSANLLRVTFCRPVSGFAYLS